MQFAALDVETANEDLASICQIGVAEYEGPSLIREWKSYIDPEDDFSAFNCSIHDIDESRVAGAPTFPAVWDLLNTLLSDRVVCSHTSFDSASVRRACAKYNLAEPACFWLDTARVARRAWPQFAHGGYRLKDLAKFLGISFVHHDALEDAKASAQVLLSAVQETKIDILGWLDRVKRPLDLTADSGIAQEGNPDGSLFGDIVVFTGALRLRRHEAAEIAARAGCAVRESVTERTTVLVVGDQDIKRLAGHQKSSKHRKAEALILKGQQLRILCESDFRTLVGI